MKFHRVKGEFPVGVVPCVHVSVAPLDQYHDPFSGFFGDFALRAMADELEGKT